MIKDWDAEYFEFAIRNGFTIEKDDEQTSRVCGDFDRDELIEACKELKLDPDDVFEYDKLKEWAETNGFAEEE